MNERIKELYIQTANETADGKEWAIRGLHNVKRFAELIVNECAMVASTETSDDGVGEVIKEHFGIKE